MNIEQMERDLVVKKEAAAGAFAKHTQAAQAHVEKDKDGKTISTGRLLTEDEKKEVQALIDEANAIKAKVVKAKGDQNMLAEIEKLTAGLPTKPVVNEGPVPSRIVKSLGTQFVESEAYDFFRKGHHRTTSAWRSPSVELEPHHRLYATILDSSLTSGGDLIVADTRPGIIPLLFKRLVIADLLADGITDSNAVNYMKETTFTNAANAVAEAAAKPESTLVFDLFTDPVRKIAHWIPVTEEMLEDVAQIRSYIDARLRLGVLIEEEDQLLNGTTTPPDVVGLLARTGLQVALARGTDTNAEAIFKQMMLIFQAAFLMPDGIVMNPTNWTTTMLMKDTAGRYFGGGPFSVPPLPTLWGLPTAVTPSIVANTALVGAYKQAAQVFRKGGIRVEASNSHSDYFIKNLVAIRAEERLALAVYRPGAFGTVTGLN